MSKTLPMWILLALLLGHKAPDPLTSDAAQASAKGSVWGAATDPSGAFVRGAAITAVDEANGTKFQTTTDANGRFKVELPAGSYSLACEAGKTRNQVIPGVEVDSGHATNVDISFSSPEEGVFCGCSMLDGTLEKVLRTSSPRNPEAVLHISVDHPEAAAGSEVWLTVVLTNISDHVISLPTYKNSGHAFEYHVGIWDPCNCPIGGADVGKSGTVADGKGREEAVPASTASKMRLAPGSSLMDRVELGKLTALTGIRTYRVRVSRLYNFGETAGERNQGDLWLISNRVSVTVKPQADSAVRPD